MFFFLHGQITPWLRWPLSGKRILSLELNYCTLKNYHAISRNYIAMQLHVGINTLYAKISQVFINVLECLNASVSVFGSLYLSYSSPLFQDKINIQQFWKLVVYVSYLNQNIVLKSAERKTNRKLWELNIQMCPLR